MKCAQCGHSKLTHASSKCSMCSCPRFKEPDMPSTDLFKRKDGKDSDGDYDFDDDDDDG